MRSRRSSVWLCVILFFVFIFWASGSGSSAPNAAVAPASTEDSISTRNYVPNPMVEDDGIFVDEEVKIPESPKQEIQQQPHIAPSLPKLYLPPLQYARPFQVFAPNQVFYKPASTEIQPAPTQSLSHLFKKFKFKGYGLSFVKSLTSWSQLGLGVRIPITPNFPDYDSHTSYPRVGAVVGLWWELETGFFFRSSISISLPFFVTIFFAAVLANALGIAPERSQFLADRIRKSKARDSIRRVGLTLSMRYVPIGIDRGVRYAIGPWLFYVPGLRTMSRILPVVFFVPALLMALWNVLFEASAVSARFAESPDEMMAEEHVIPSPVSAVSNAQAQQDGEASDPGLTERSSNQGADLKRLRGVGYWHSAWLQWCNTKTTGLGLNTGENLNIKRSASGERLMDASRGMSVVFDISPFFPFEMGEATPYNAMKEWASAVWSSVLEVYAGVRDMCFATAGRGSGGRGSSFAGRIAPNDTSRGADGREKSAGVSRKKSSRAKKKAVEVL